MIAHGLVVSEIRGSVLPQHLAGIRFTLIPLVPEVRVKTGQFEAAVLAYKVRRLCQLTRASDDDSVLRAVTVAVDELVSRLLAVVRI